MFPLSGGEAIVVSSANNGMGGWHEVQTADGKLIKLQRNALVVRKIGHLVRTHPLLLVLFVQKPALHTERFYSSAVSCFAANSTGCRIHRSTPAKTSLDVSAVGVPEAVKLSSGSVAEQRQRLKRPQDSGEVLQHDSQHHCWCS